MQHVINKQTANLRFCIIHFVFIHCESHSREL